MTELEKLAAMGPSRVSISLARFGSIRRTAIVLGISHTALRRYMGKEQIAKPKKRNWTAARHLQSAPKAGLAVWIREHPSVKLPRNVQAIVKLTGLTQDQIKTYLYQGRLKLKKRLKQLPDLHFKNLTFKTLKGEEIEIHAKDKYKFAIDHWSLNVYIIIGVGNRCLIADLDDFEQRVRKA